MRNLLLQQRAARFWCCEGDQLSGIRQATDGLGSCRSTTELRPQLFEM